MAISEAISITPTMAPLRAAGLFDGVISVILPGILTPFSARKTILLAPICRYAVAPNRRKSHARVERQAVLQFFDASDQLLDLLLKCGRE